MPQPAADPEWDTNQTNVTPTVAAHKTDGWADDEIPPADEENYWKNLVYLWIVWFKANIAAFTRWHWVGTSQAVLTGATFVSPNGYLSIDAPGEKAEWIRFDVPVGAIITKVGVRHLLASGIVGNATAELVITNDTAAPTVIATVNLDNDITPHNQTVTLGSSYTVPDTGALYWRVTALALGNEHRVFALGAEINTTGQT